MPPFDEFSMKTLSDIINSGVSSKLVYEGSICDAYPCWNDGVCVESNSTSKGYFCMCSDPFIGNHCQTKVSDNCSSLICEVGSICIQEFSTCFPIANLTFLNGCQTNPCLNDGHCVLIRNHTQRCLCSSLYQGVLCEIPTSVNFLGHYSTPSSWTFLQSLFLITMLILFLAGCIAFCYGGNLSCYLLIPDSKNRYSKWRDVPSDEFNWDPEESDEDDLNIFGRRKSSHSSNNSKNANQEFIELKSRPMTISTTEETFVSYNPTIISPQEAQKALLPSIN